ncbi:MAG: hypothetical protein CMJ18_04435 [Phycisphaeraceae bacterium]|nr:hypothetical protein [Phycisphaeraceae bacterium]
MLFAAPLMLAGLAALALPIIVHLLDRSRTAPVDWPTLRFLAAVSRQATQRRRVKQLIVLTMRLLLLGLIALAMAMPYARGEGAADDPGLPLTLVIVLDHSYSMGYRDRSATRSHFDRARSIALDRVNELSMTDEVGLVLAGDRAQVLTELPTRDHAQVARLIETVELSQRSTHYGEALSAALSLAALDASSTRTEGEEGITTVTERRRARRQVMVLGDLQAAGWKSALNDERLAQAEPEVALHVVDVTSRRPGDPEDLATHLPNRFVRRIRAEKRGARIRVHVDIGGQVDATGSTRVTLYIDNQTVGSPRALDPGRRRVSFDIDAPAPGVHQGRAEIEADALPIDDRMDFVLRLVGDQRLTIVDGDPSDVPHLSETYYLDAALRSSGQTRAIEHYRVADLSNRPLDHRGGLMLCHVSRLEGSALTRIENFLRRGGSVFVSLGARVDPEHLNRDWRFLPATLGPPTGGGAARAWSLVVEEADHPLVRGLDLSATRFFSFFTTGPQRLRPDAQIIASYSNGPAALIEGSFESGGRVVLLTGSIDAEGSNLPLRRVFVPFVDRLADHLTTPRLDGRHAVLGQPVRFEGPAALASQSLVVTDPQDASHKVEAVVDRAADRAVATFGPVASLGVHRVEGDALFDHGSAFAAQLDTRESNLETVQPDRIRDGFGDRRVLVSRSASASSLTDDKSGAQTRRRAYWPLLLLLGLLAFVAETIAANLMTRRRTVAPPPTTQYLG